MTPLLGTFPARLRAARGALLFTQEQVGRVLSVSPRNVANWEAGRSRPSFESLAKLSEIYCVSLDWLLTGKHRLPHSFTTPSDLCPHLVSLAKERCPQ